MTGDDIEKALQAALNGSAGSPGLVVTLRRHEDYERLLLILDDLRDLNDRLRSDISRMSGYAQLYMRALDDLRECRRQMEAYGLDTSFIVSLSP